MNVRCGAVDWGVQGLGGDSGCRCGCLVATGARTGTVGAVTSTIVVGQVDGRSDGTDSVQWE